MATITTEKNQTLPEVEHLLKQAQALIEQGRNFLLNEGKVIDTTKYLTIKRYCQKYSIEEESVVTNWIRRGIIPQEDIVTLSELNNLRMIVDKKYK